MKIRLLVIGKTEEGYLHHGLMEYLNRVKHYMPFEITEIPALKNVSTLTRDQQNAKEAEAITRQLQPGDVVVLLDERGKSTARWSLPPSSTATSFPAPKPWFSWSEAPSDSTPP